MEDLPQLDIQENIEELCKEDVPIAEEKPAQDLTDVSQPLAKVEAESIFEKPSNKVKPKPKQTAAQKKALSETRRRNLEKARQKKEIERRVKAEMKREKEEAIIRKAKEEEQLEERPPTPTPPPIKKVSPSPMPSKHEEFSKFMENMEKYKVMKHEWVEEQEKKVPKPTPKPASQPATPCPPPIQIINPNPYSSAFNW